MAATAGKGGWRCKGKRPRLVPALGSAPSCVSRRPRAPPAPPRPRFYPPRRAAHAHGPPRPGRSRRRRARGPARGAAQAQGARPGAGRASLPAAGETAGSGGRKESAGRLEKCCVTISRKCSASPPSPPRSGSDAALGSPYEGGSWRCSQCGQSGAGRREEITGILFFFVFFPLLFSFPAPKARGGPGSVRRAGPSAARRAGGEHWPPPELPHRGAQPGAGRLLWKQLSLPIPGGPGEALTSHLVYFSVF